MAALPLIVTRPAPDNQRWVHALRNLGHRAEGLPLMDIGPSRSPQAATALKAALARMDEVSGGYRAFMFVSVNAVRYFFSHPLVMAAEVTIVDSPMLRHSRPQHGHPLLVTRPRHQPSLA